MFIAEDTKIREIPEDIGFEDSKISLRLLNDLKGRAVEINTDVALSEGWGRGGILRVQGFDEDLQLPPGAIAMWVCENAFRDDVKADVKTYWFGEQIDSLKDRYSWEIWNTGFSDLYWEKEPEPPDGEPQVVQEGDTEDEEWAGEYEEEAEAEEEGFEFELDWADIDGFEDEEETEEEETEPEDNEEWSLTDELSSIVFDEETEDGFPQWDDSKSYKYNIGKLYQWAYGEQDTADGNSSNDEDFVYEPIEEEFDETEEVAIEELSLSQMRDIIQYEIGQQQEFRRLLEAEDKRQQDFVGILSSISDKLLERCGTVEKAEEKVTGQTEEQPVGTTRYFLVDFENVHENGITRCELLKKTDTLVLFYTSNLGRSFKRRVQERMFHCKANVIEFDVPPGAQSLDKHLLSYLGYCLDEHKAHEEYYIISRDKGYEPIADFWKALGYSVRVEENIARVLDEQGVKYSELVSHMITYLMNTKKYSEVEAVNLAKSMENQANRVQRVKAAVHTRMCQAYGQMVGAEYYREMRKYL